MDRLIDYHVLNDRNNSWDKFLLSLPPGQKKFWLLAKAMRGAKAKVGVLTRDGAEVHNNLEKANIIAQAFEDVHQITSNIPSNQEQCFSTY